MRTRPGSQRVGGQPQYDVPGVEALEFAAKKKSLHDSQRETPRVSTLRQDFQTQFMGTLGKMIKRLKFLDESGSHLGLTRLFGRATPGQRVVEATPGYSGVHYTLIATLAWQEVTAPWIFEGSINRLTFEAYVRSQLLPTLRPGDIVVMDNLSAHTGETIRQLIEAQGARLQFLPPYSPDFNPIELCWSKVKTALRTAKARTFDALLEALAKALRSISLTDIQNWFAHCGYVLS
jgi:transposase